MPQSNISEIARLLEAQSKCRPHQGRRYLRVSSPFRPDSDADSFSFDLETGGGTDFVSGEGYNAKQIARQLGLQDDWKPPAHTHRETRQERRRHESETPDWQAKARAVLWGADDLPADVVADLVERGVPPTANLRWNRRGRWNERGLLIPYWSNGQLTAIRTRKNGRKFADGRSGKYLSVRGGTGKRLFNRDAITPDSVVVLVETELDAIALNALGAPIVAVATGSTSGGRADAKLVKSARRAYAAFDNDDAGDKASAWWGWAAGAIRFRPTLNDPGEMFQHGIDVRAWIATAPEPEPEPPALALSEAQIAAAFFSMPEGPATMTAMLPHLDLPERFSAADVYRALTDRNAIDTSERTVRGWMRDCVMLESAGNRWAFTDKATITMRLEVRLARRQQRIQYARQLPLEAYADDDGYDLIDDLRGDRRDPQYEGADWDDLRFGYEPVEMPATFKAGFMAWWYDGRLSDGETVGRPELTQRTGLTAHQQKKAHSRLRYPAPEQHSAIVAAATASEAIRISGLQSSFAFRVSEFEWQVNGANTYHKTERQLFDIREDVLPEKTADPSKAAPSKPAKRPPILPDIDPYDCDPYGAAFRTRALFYEWQDNGLLDVDDWRGKVVTLAGLVEYQREKQAKPVSADYRRWEASIDIPF